MASVASRSCWAAIPLGSTLLTITAFAESFVPAGEMLQNDLNRRAPRVIKID
jgi:hypothetical protein